MEQSRKELTDMGYSYQGGFTLIVVLFILLVIVGSAYVC
ncbi:YjcZ family sporulation protein [Alkalihalophilus lindianensis]|uniref:YjcZ family sporulation protein n=1 Tax=Alkalihalophilus lindianensis TaxID=1630542 RepID=A0ABU3X5X5_9BACI|nr:YjcZ family sporulation protein [Alkalihalophilus lindianensis]MDV2683306.1 YjcZ family sporulation protein [Alkalihalophilus lindianensis]